MLYKVWLDFKRDNSNIIKQMLDTEKADFALEQNIESTQRNIPQGENLKEFVFPQFEDFCLDVDDFMIDEENETILWAETLKVILQM